MNRYRIVVEEDHCSECLAEEKMFAAGMKRAARLKCWSGKIPC